MNLPPRSSWRRHGNRLLWALAALLAVAALLRLGLELHRAVLETGRLGAIDLRILYRQVGPWFAGLPLFKALASAVYPPATYVLLWPFFGWLDETPARWLWAGASLLALFWLARTGVQESGARTPAQRAVAALVPLAMTATGVTLGNGQMTLLLVAPAVAAALLVYQGRRPALRDDLLAAALLVFSLMKPTLSAPFFWLLLFAPGRRARPASFAVAGYVLLAFLACAFQEGGIVSLHVQWLQRGLVGAADGAVDGGYANLHSWLAALRLQQLLPLPVLLAAGALLSVGTLLGLGVWVCRHRHVDVWLLLGVTGIVARVWTYHRVYDDVLILLPMIALARLAAAGGGRSGTGAAVLLAVTAFTVLAPAGWPTGGCTLAWTGTLFFLMARAAQQRKALAAASAQNAVPHAATAVQAA